MEDDAELWDVLLGPGRTERMTLDQLDGSYQSGVISAGTLIREPGSSEWRPLYEVAGLDPPDLPSSIAPPASSPRSAPPPVRSATTPRSAAPSSLSAPRSTPPTAESPSRPPALPARRSKPSNRTSRGVPLPSVPPRDEPVNLSPKPLTPPTTSSRRVSAPPSISSHSGSRVRRAPPSIVPAGVASSEPVAASARDTASLNAPPRRSSERPTSAVPAAVAPASHTAAMSHTAPLLSAPPPPPPITPALTVPVGDQSHALEVQAPPLPDNAFAHLSSPPGGVSPSVFPLELPRAPEPVIYTPGQPLPPVADPWTAPPPTVVEPPPPFHTYTPATDTAQPLILEEPPLTRSPRPSAWELCFWALTIMVASSVVLHRNGSLQSWFGKYGYALMEVQVMGKPSLNTVAGVKVFLAETAPKGSGIQTP